METLRPEDGRWHAKSIISDLVNQGGLLERDLGFNGSFFFYKRRPFAFTYEPNRSFIIGLVDLEDASFEEVIEAFSKVLEYKPFCRYDFQIKGYKNTTLMYEWNKENPEERLRILMSNPAVIDLVIF